MFSKSVYEKDSDLPVWIVFLSRNWTKYLGTANSKYEKPAEKFTA